MISVIIPTYNRPTKTISAIASVRAQLEVAQERIEIVVVDDASTERLPDGLGRDGIRIVRQPVNAGPAAARNAGISASRGDLIAFLDSDDRWLSGKLAAQLALYRHHAPSHIPRDRLVVTCGFYMPNRRTGRIEARIPIPARATGDLVTGCWFAPGTTFLAHRSVFERAGFFDARMRRLEDYDWFLRFGLAGGSVLVSPTAAAVIAPSGEAQHASIRFASQLIRNKLGGPDLPPLARRHRRWLEAYLALELAVSEKVSGRYAACAVALGRSLWLKPRLRPALLPHWQRSTDVPGEVVACYQEMIGASALTC